MANKNFSIQASLYIKNYSEDADYSTYYLNLLNGLDFNKFFNYDDGIRYSRIIDLLQSLPGVEGVKHVLISHGTSNVWKENGKDTFVFDKENSFLNFLSMEIPELNPIGIINVDPEEDIFYDFMAYKIGDISDGVFTPLDEFSRLNLSITEFTIVNLDNDELNNSKTIAKQVSDYIKYELETGPTTTSYYAYNAPFRNIRDFGVYVIIQDYSFELVITDNGTQDRGAVILPERYADPVIVAIPVQGENRYILNVKMPMKQLDPAIDGWKTLLNSNMTAYAPGGEINGSGHFELYVPSVQTVIIYDSFADSLENYYIIDGDSSAKLTDITNYSRNKDILSFDWAAHGTGLAIYCATYQNWTEVDISTQNLAIGGLTQWSGTITIEADDINNDYILWRYKNFADGSQYEYVLHKLSEPKDDLLNINTSINSSTSTTITLDVIYIGDFPLSSLIYEIIPACELTSVVS